MIEYDKSDQIVGKIVRDRANRLKDKVYVQTHESKITYEGMEAVSNSFANAFLNLGMKKGDKVCLMLENSLEHLYCWFGLGKIGAVDVPINMAYKGQILEYIINNSEAKVLIVDRNYLDRIQFLERGLKKIRQVIIYDSPKAEKAEGSLHIDTLNLKELFSFPDTAPSVDVHYSDLATIMYTSGTTGPSKGVMISHAFGYSVSRKAAENLGLLPTDIQYICLPLFHANARMLCVYPCLLTGAQVAMSPRFSLSNFWDDIRHFKATVFNGLGAVGPLLFADKAKSDDADNPVRLAFVVPVPKPYKEFEKRFNLKITTGYGMTEINMPLYAPLNEEMPEGTCGKSIPGFDLRIVDENDEELPYGQVGELLIRHSEPYTLLSGYYNMPEKTLESYRNLWFHTGDAFYRDKDGWYYFVDRIKDSIRRRGENISSFEVENVINSHPAVLECAAIAIKNPLLTEDDVKACLVLKPGETLTPEALISFCEPRMPYFHIPRYIEILESLPKTPTDKVRKTELRDRGITPATWDIEKTDIKIKR